MATIFIPRQILLCAATCKHLPDPVYEREAESKLISGQNAHCVLIYV